MLPMKKKAPLIILDRDGVINIDSPNYVKSATEWHPIPGSIEAIVALKKAQYTVALATNQSGIGRGYFDKAALDSMHAKLGRLLAVHNTQIDAIYHCPHLPNAGCQCRKPQPGMLLQALEDFSQTAANTWMVGDSYKDVQAALAAGCKPIVVKTGNGLDTIRRITADIPVFDDLQAVAAFLCAETTLH